MENAEKERIYRVSFRFIPTRRVIENSKKIAKKFKKYRYVFYSSQNRFEKDEKMKTIVPFRSIPTRREIENSKTKAKKFKKLKYTIMASFLAKIGWKRPRKRKNKNYRSVPKRRVIENSKKISKKFKKLNNTIMASFQAKIGWKT